MNYDTNKLYNKLGQFELYFHIKSKVLEFEHKLLTTINIFPYFPFILEKYVLRDC